MFSIRVVWVQTEFDITDEEAAAAIEALAASLAVVSKIDAARLGWRDRVGFVSAIEAAGRQIPSIEHGVIAVMDRFGDAKSARVPNTRMLLADVLRVTETDASHRIGMSRELAQRAPVNGEPDASGLARNRSGPIRRSHRRTTRPDHPRVHA